MSKNRLSIIFNEIFEVNLAGYLFLLLVETIKNGFVSNFFDLNILLIVVVIAGLGIVFFQNTDDMEKQKSKRANWLLIVVFSLTASFVVYYKTMDLGFLSYLIAVIAGQLVFLLSYLVISPEE